MFLGTKRYPEEGAFKKFLQKHVPWIRVKQQLSHCRQSKGSHSWPLPTQGGSSNAFTGMEATGYHFVVQEDALRPALGHFASFFAEPLLRADLCS